MPVFFHDDKRVLFIHVPKTGGTAIETFFERNRIKVFYLDRGGSVESLNAVRRSSPQHMCAAQLQATFKLKCFNYVFMLVRHPVRRLLSRFVMETGGGKNADQLEDWLSEKFIQVMADPEVMDNHLRPQSDFLVPEAEVFRLEDGLDNKLVATLESRTGWSFEDPKIRREMSGRGRIPDFATVHPALRRMVHGYYAADFTHFGYASAHQDD